MQEAIYRISSESPEFCKRYYKKQFGLLIQNHFPDTITPNSIWNNRLCLWSMNKSIKIRLCKTSVNVGNA